MQMIDVMKRLAELDSKSPTLRENQQMEECGIMPGMMGGMPEHPPMPASINMTAGSGEELSDMLATIMQLAGVKQYGQSEPEIAIEPMGSEPQAGEVLTLEPVDEPGDATTDMRSMIDKLNPMNNNDQDADDHDIGDEEETDEERMYNNSGNDPTNVPPSSKDAMVDSGIQNHDQSGPPGQGDRMDGNMPKATMEQQLMADYKKFVSEGNKKVDEISTALVNNVHDARRQNAQQAHADDSDEHSARIQAKADSMGKSKWDRSVTAEPGPLAAAADAAQQKFDRNKKLTAKRPNSNYGRDQAELGAWGQRVGQSQGSGQSVWRK
jgi:hypothetical protein